MTARNRIERRPPVEPVRWAALAAACLLALGASGAAGQAKAPVYQPDGTPGALKQDLERKNFKLDQASGNYLSNSLL
jgi:hypothetical protein